MPIAVVQVTTHPGTNTNKSHSIGRLEAGFYRKVTYRVDYQHIATGHHWQKSGQGCYGDDNVTQTALYTDTPDTSKKPQALSRMGRAGTSLAANDNHVQDTESGTKRPSSAFGASCSRNPKELQGTLACLLTYRGWPQTHCVAGDDLQPLIQP